MAYIATLKKNNTVIYPQTKSTAVYEDDGVTPIDDVVVKKSTAVADADKMIKADGTKALVGASNIDFATFESGLTSSFTVPAGGGANIDITFSTPLPNSNYTVLLTKNSTPSYFAGVFEGAELKTTTGFRLITWNTNGNDCVGIKYGWLVIPHE